MYKTIQLTEAECQYLCDVLLQQIKVLADQIGATKAEKYLRGIDKAQAYDIYQKLIKR